MREAEEMVQVRQASNAVGVGEREAKGKEDRVVGSSVEFVLECERKVLVALLRVYLRRRQRQTAPLWFGRQRSVNGPHVVAKELAQVVHIVDDEGELPAPRDAAHRKVEPHAELLLVRRAGSVGVGPNGELVGAGLLHLRAVSAVKARVEGYWAELYG